MIEVGGKKLLFDAGRGVLQRLYESEVDIKKETTVFLTHLHNDHIEGLASLWITPWFLLGRTEQMKIWGPVGTLKMRDGMRTMYGHDVQNRSDEHNKKESLDLMVTEIENPKENVCPKKGDPISLGQELYKEKDNTPAAHEIKVTAFPVCHADGNPAFGYSVTYNNRKVVLSGDTTYSRNVVHHGMNADLIVHNVIATGKDFSHTPEMQIILGKLTTPEQAADVFKEAKPKMAVFSHIVKKGLPGAEGDKEIMKRTQETYKGPLEMGVDRMIIDIGSQVKLIKPKVISDLTDLDFKKHPDK